MVLIYSHSGREAGAAVHGGNAWEEAEAAAGREESKEGSIQCFSLHWSAIAKPTLSSKHSYLNFSGSLQRLELLPCRPIQTHLVLLRGEKGYPEGEHWKSSTELIYLVSPRSLMIPPCCAAELCMWPASEPHRSWVFTCTRVHQKTQLLPATVRFYETQVYNKGSIHRKSMLGVEAAVILWLLKLWLFFSGPQAPWWVWISAWCLLTLSDEEMGDENTSKHR